MSTIDDIEDAVKRLTPEDLAHFRGWFAEFDGHLWDLQMERDATSGKLVALAEQALAEHRAGLTRDLDPDRP